MYVPATFLKLVGERRSSGLIRLQRHRFGMMVEPSLPTADQMRAFTPQIPNSYVLALDSDITEDIDSISLELLSGLQEGKLAMLRRLDLLQETMWRGVRILLQQGPEPEHAERFRQLYGAPLTESLLRRVRYFAWMDDHEQVNGSTVSVFDRGQMAFR